MISFFNKIRRNLLNKNRFSKYMLYAIGEIFLIVIGIFIAVQLNNLNESRKQEVLEIQYLNRLLEDLALDTVYINNRMQFSKKAGGNFNLFIQKMYQTQKNFEETKELFKYLAMNTDHLVIQNATYLELNSTGKLSIISNPDLKKSIVNHYKLSDEIAVNIEEFNNYSTKFLFNTASNVSILNKFFALEEQVASKSKTPYTNSDMFLKNEWKFINKPDSPEFQSLESLAFTYWYRHEEYLGFFEDLKLNARHLLTDINKELNFEKK